MDNFPERKIGPSRWRFFGLLIIAAFFVGGGRSMILDGNPIGWFVLGGFGLGGLFFALSMIPGSTYLKLDEKGFTVRTVYRSYSYKWTDVTHFSVTSYSMNKWIAFNFSPHYEKSPRLRKANVAMTGYEGVVMWIYSIKAEELAELMNAYRKNAIDLKYTAADWYTNPK